MATITTRTGRTVGRESDVLGDLHQLEADLAAAVERTRDLRREHTERYRNVYGYTARDQRGLIDDLRKILMRDPAQFRADGSPVSKTSDAGKLQAQIDEQTGPMPALLQEAEHAERLEARARQDHRAFIFANGEAIFAAMRPEAHVIAEETNQAARVFEAALDAYWSFCDRMTAIANVWNGRPGASAVPNRVTGAEAANDLRKIVRKVDLPGPELGS
jgi:hypothetical protein